MKKIFHVTTEAKNCRVTTQKHQQVLRFNELYEPRFAALLNYINEREKPKRIAVISWDTAAQQNLSKFISGKLKKLGVKELKIFPFAIDYRDFSTPVLAVRKWRADSLVLLSPNFPGIDALYKELVEQNIGVPIYTVGFVADLPYKGKINQATILYQMLKSYGQKFPEVFTETDYDKDNNDIAKKFYQLYSKKYNEFPNAVSARAYDSVLFISKLLDLVDLNYDLMGKKKSEIKNFQGVTGIINVLDSGDIVKESNTIQIWRGTEREIVIYKGPKPKPHTFK